MWTPQRTFAWGKSGHEIVAAIAKQSLSAPELAQAQALLAAANFPDMISVSTWADEYRSIRAETFQWHFVDIPLNAPSYDEQRDCHAGATSSGELTCVVGKIEEFKSKLANKTLPDAVRGQALAFLIHFVGDAHQPLHASNNNDRGGNDVPVSFFGQTQDVYNNKQYSVNLHYVWDTGIIARRYGEQIRPEQIAQALLNHISGETKARWCAGTPTDWANEAHAIAVAMVYQDLPLGAPKALDEPYYEKALLLVNNQLLRAGVRLGCAIKSALR